MKSAEIREKFLKYFENQGHQRVKSSSLVPAADPTLLFTNAGMVQFKDCFLGLQDPGYRRATTCQKCVRAGGKHNDLENVGFTARHHTFFEMLGNFSFGDYFKKEAIAFAWELIIDHYHLPKDRLRVTVFEKDDEAFDLWKAQGLAADRITRLGEKDNFWAMGDTGPCGPCSEIYFDWGPQFGCGKPQCAPGCDCPRFLEFWNLVFMQFNRDASGKLTPLPKPSVDTGAGLERMSCILQGVFSNYDTDCFQPLLEAIGKRVGKTYGKNDEDSIAMRVVADHLRSGTFLMADGVHPSNEGRGYVLRRILRRAIRYGKKLGQDQPFLYQLVSTVTGTLGGVYPEIVKSKAIIEEMMREEEHKFHETLHRGMGLLEGTIQKMRAVKQSVLPGDVAFKLYDTFGFPLDLIEVIARENKLTVDDKGFQSLMDQQREQSVWNKGSQSGQLEALTKTLETKKPAPTFVGYEVLTAQSPLLLLFNYEGKEVASLPAGEQGFAVFAKTPFYAESGGQVGDQGTLTYPGTSADVLTTSKIAKVIVHQVQVQKGKLESGRTYDLQVNPGVRKYTMINHTATHMLHAALRQVLGDRVKQAGSLVDRSRLRFDFTYPRPVSADELGKIESLVNDEIRRGSDVTVEEMPYDQAMQSGALAFFDEKYGDRVRVVRVGEPDRPFSVELCGGTHLPHTTADIGFFRILSESSVASGVRRIEAITSDTAIQFLLDREWLLQNVEKALGTRGDATLRKIEQITTDLKSLQKSNEKLQLGMIQKGSSNDQALWEKKVQVKDIQLVMENLPAVGVKILRNMVDQVRDKLKERVIVVLASETDGKLMLCVGLSKDLVGRWDAAKLIQPLAEEVGGTGGGRADFAQAGGTKPEALPRAFEKFHAWLQANT